MEYYRSGQLSTVIEHPLLERSLSSSQTQISPTETVSPPSPSPGNSDSEGDFATEDDVPQQDDTRLPIPRRMSDFAPHLSPIPMIDEDIWVYCSPDSSRGPSPSPAAISIESFVADESKQADQVTQHINLVLNRLVAEGIVRQGAPQPAPELVDSLPDVDIDSIRADDEGCPICQDAFDCDKIVKQLPCKHLYHRECISLWFERHASCPLCRLRLEVGNADDEILQQEGISAEMQQEDASARFERFHGRRARFGFLRRAPSRASSRPHSPARSSPGSHRGSRAGSRRRSFLTDKMRDIYPRVEALEAQNEDQRRSNLRRRRRESLSRTLFGRRGHVSPVNRRSVSPASRPRTASLPASNEGKTTFSRFRPRGLSGFMKRKFSDTQPYRAVEDEPKENKESYSVSLSGSCSPNLDRSASMPGNKRLSRRHARHSHGGGNMRNHPRALFDEERVHRSSHEYSSRRRPARRVSFVSMEFEPDFSPPNRCRWPSTDSFDMEAYPSNQSTPRQLSNAGMTPPSTGWAGHSASHPARRYVGGIEIPSFSSDNLERMSSTQLEKLAAAFETETSKIRTELWKRRRFAEENLCTNCWMHKPQYINLPCRHLGMCGNCYAEVQQNGVASFSDKFVSFACRRCCVSVINVLEIEVETHTSHHHRGGGRTPGSHFRGDMFE